MKSNSDDKLQRLLEGLLDGEGLGSQGELLRRQLQENDPAVSAEWKALNAVRDEVRNWHSGLRSDASGRERQVDLWARISSDLRREERLPSEASWLERFLETARAAFTMPVLAGGVAVVAIGIFSVLSVPRTQPEQMFAAAGSSSASSSQAGLVRVGNVGEVAPLNIPEAMAVAYRNEIMRTHSGRMIPVLPTSDKNFVLGGLRSHGADIDWVKSDKPVKILTLDDEEGTPPIIWVARRNPAIDAYAGLD